MTGVRHVTNTINWYFYKLLYRYLADLSSSKELAVEL
jgi:hypothetical protein